MNAFSVGYVQAYARHVAIAADPLALQHLADPPPKEPPVHGVVPRPLLSGGQVALPSELMKPHQLLKLAQAAW